MFKSVILSSLLAVGLCACSESDVPYPGIECETELERCEFFSHYTSSIFSYWANMITCSTQFVTCVQHDDQDCTRCEAAYFSEYCTDTCETYVEPVMEI